MDAVCLARHLTSVLDAIATQQREAIYKATENLLGNWCNGARVSNGMPPVTGVENRTQLRRAWIICTHLRGMYAPRKAVPDPNPKGQSASLPPVPRFNPPMPAPVMVDELQDILDALKPKRPAAKVKSTRRRQARAVELLLALFDTDPQNMGRVQTDLAKELQVHVGTISRALNNQKYANKFAALYREHGYSMPTLSGFAHKRRKAQTS